MMTKVSLAVRRERLRSSRGFTAALLGEVERSDIQRDVVRPWCRVYRRINYDDKRVLLPDVDRVNDTPAGPRLAAVPRSPSTRQ